MPIWAVRSLSEALVSAASVVVRKESVEIASAYRAKEAEWCSGRR